MPDLPPSNQPNVDHRQRHFNRCGPEIRTVLKRLVDDILVPQHFDIDEVHWEPEKWVSYFSFHHDCWLAIDTYPTHLRLRCQVEKASFPRPGLAKEEIMSYIANKLGVKESDVDIRNHPKGMHSLQVQVKPDFNPTNETLLDFLKDVYANAQRVWG